MAKITVIDALMGQGKTTWMLNRVRVGGRPHPFRPDNERERWIYICITDKEKERVKKALPALGMQDQVPIDGRKSEHLRRLIRDDQNIVATHELFRRITQETVKVLQERNYNLVIDETLDVVRQYEGLTKQDHQVLWDQEMVYKDEDGHTLRWNHKKWPQYEGKFKEVRNLCDNGNLLSTREGMYIWEFPISVLRGFKQIFICSYMFEGQMMADYFKANGVKHDLMGLKNGKLVSHSEADTTDLKRGLAALITVVDNEKMNAIGQSRGQSRPLSVNWWNYRCRKGAKLSAQREVGAVKRNLSNFFRNIAKVKAKDAMWSVFGDFRSKVTGKGYGGKHCFVAVNARATNDYSHKKACAYVANIFMPPVLLGFFQDRGVKTRTDLFALQQLVQWIWRSRIRNGEPITLYLPSDRMRTILIEWIKHPDAEIVTGRLLWDDEHNCETGKRLEVARGHPAIAAE